ncbi:MAG: hypothetical protein IKY67_12590 [Paludibacteraceae bacterium]|nr:hypothetical protein [Paludibacteraceae bacterium]
MHNYLQSKVRQPHYDEGPYCNSAPYYTYKVEVARFDTDFHQPPSIHMIEVRLSDDEYLRLLQWQLKNPNTGFKGYDEDISDVMVQIECEVEAVVFSEEEIGTYAIYLTEIRDDAEQILQTLEI